MKSDMLEVKRNGHYCSQQEKSNEILWPIQWYMLNIAACLSLVLHVEISQLFSALWRVIPRLGLDCKSELKYKLINCYMGKDEVESDVFLRD